MRVENRLDLCHDAASQERYKFWRPGGEAQDPSQQFASLVASYARLTAQWPKNIAPSVTTAVPIQMITAAFFSEILGIRFIM